MLGQKYSIFITFLMMFIINNVKANEDQEDSPVVEAGPCNPGCVWECVDPESPWLCHCNCN
jgi:hypothetical protein